MEITAPPMLVWFLSRVYVVTKPFHFASRSLYCVLYARDREERAALL